MGYDAGTKDQMILWGIVLGGRLKLYTQEVAMELQKDRNDLHDLHEHGGKTTFEVVQHCKEEKVSTMTWEYRMEGHRTFVYMMRRGVELHQAVDEKECRTSFNIRDVHNLNYERVTLALWVN